MPDDSKITITKLDGALRQTETAITLWFYDGDPFSIQTLAAAATQVLQDVNQKRKGPPILPDLSFIKPEYHKEYYNALKAAPNFLKHADKDPDASISFDPTLNMHMLFEAVFNFGIITKQPRTPILNSMFHWVFVHHPSFFQSEQADLLRKSLPINDLLKLNRIKFFMQFTKGI
jgi:hypothetical protein